MRTLYRIPASAAACLLLTAGCFTREETIEIRPDGSASVTYAVKGDPGELDTGDAMPSRLGWASEQTRETDQSGNEIVTTTWRKDFRRLDAYPASFAAPGDPQAKAFLQTATRLSIDRQPGRTVYRFTRTYVGRRAGMYKELQENAVPRDLMEKAEKDEASLTPEERDTVFAGLAEYESLAMLLRVRDGLGKATAAGVLDARSFEPVMMDLARYLGDRLTGRYLMSFMALPEEDQEREERALKDGFRAEVDRLLPARARDEAKAYLDLEEKAFEVTQDLNDERFSLEVRMPGTIVYANTSVMEGSAASWEFSGEDLAEGDRVLTAVSVVEHDATVR